MPFLDIGTSNTSITGAAAALRMRWPDTSWTVGNMVPKLSGQSQALEVDVQQGVSFTTGVVQDGQRCRSVLSNNAPTTGIQGFIVKVNFHTERAGGALQEDYACWSFRATMEFAALTGPTLDDLGIVMCAGNQNFVSKQGSANAGVRFGPTDVNASALLARRVNAGPLTVNEVLATPPVTTKWHTWELQCVSGAAVADPFLQGFIDGVAVTQRYSWTAAAGLLPPLTTVAANPYYQFYAGNATLGVCPLVYISEMVLTAGRTQADLL